MPAIASSSLTPTGAEQPPAPFTKTAFSTIEPSASVATACTLV